ncbi:MAG: hypothetical protein ACOC1L_08320 [Bacillota bacterium]
MPDSKTRMKTETAKLYGFKTLGSPFMVILLVLIVYFGYMSFGDANFFDLFFFLIGVYILWLILQVYNIPKKTVILNDQAILVTYEKAPKKDKTIPVDQIKELFIKRSFLGDLFNYQNIIILKEDEEHIFLNGLKDAEMLVNMVKQIATEKAMEEQKKQEQDKPIKEEDFNFTNHN